jgi:hypothetical protein
MSDTRIYFQRTVGYTIGVRLFPGDWNGVALTSDNPYVGIDADKLKDFKRANRYLIEKGLLIQIEEPSTDFENENMLSDAEISALVKGNYFVFTKKLKNITSEETVWRILEEAKTQNKPPKTIDVINERLEEVSDVSLATMRGVE